MYLVLDWHYLYSILLLFLFLYFPQDKTEQIQGWLTGTKQDPKSAAVFKREARVTEGDATFWLTIPEPIFLNLERQVHPGDPVGFYLDWIGTTHTEHVFIVGAFAR